jgi:SAM-dependent methyltransferase
MKLELLEIIRCPISGQKLILVEKNIIDNLIESGTLHSEDGKYIYSIKNFIPRFVPESNYADNFGMQWNLFRRTQLDSYSGQNISGERFWKSTNWSPNELKGKWVLDCGCGAGRFAEIALMAGANVIALDYSSAVDACYSNLKHFPNLHVIQGDIYSLPLKLEAFQYVYSLGVLQHTPDVKKAFNSLPKFLANNGYFCIDFYEKNLKSKFLPKFWLRPITKRMNEKKLFQLLQKWTPRLLFLSNLFSNVPIIGLYLKRVVPVANYKGILNLSDKQLEEWALLDTFDWLAPEYDNPQNSITISKWLNNASFQNIEVLKVVHLVGRAQKI